jgi:hypothetical protein
VSGTIYSAEDPDAPVVTLFTKDGCTLCDKVKDVRKSLRGFLVPFLLLTLEVVCRYSSLSRLSFLTH